MDDQGALAEKLRHAGATFGVRHGRLTALHFGSATSELAVCRRAAGLVYRSDLDIHLARGSSALIDQLTEVELGRPLATGELTVTGGTCWGRVTLEEAIIVCGGAISPRLHRQLKAGARRCTGLQLQDRSDAPVAIGVIGRAAVSLLSRLGVPALSQPLGSLGVPAPSGPQSLLVPPAPAAPAGSRSGRVVRGELDGVEVRWMIFADEFSLALVGAEHATTVWEAIERADHTAGLVYVGAEACERFAAALRIWSAPPVSGTPLVNGTPQASGAHEVAHATR